jgi:hypothetical protein
MTLWMDRRRSEHIAPSSPEIDSCQNAGTIPHTGGLHVPMEAVACPNNRAVGLFSPGTCVLEGIDSSLAIKINYIEAQARSESEVGGRMRLPPGPDDLQIGRGVMESMATVASWNQRRLRTRRQREHVDACRCVGECSGKVVHGFSLFRHGVSAQPAMTDDDSAPLFAILGRTEISRLDPPLTLIWPAHAT